MRLTVSRRIPLRASRACELPPEPYCEYRFSKVDTQRFQTRRFLQGTYSQRSLSDACINRYTELEMDHSVSEALFTKDGNL